MAIALLVLNQPQKTDLKMVLNERHQRAIFYADLIFGSYTLFSLSLALLAWYRGEGSWRGVVAFLLYFSLNGLISRISTHAHNRFTLEVGRVVAATIIAPLAYIFAAPAFSHWWPAFMIMALGGVLMTGLLSNQRWWGRLIVIYYACLLLVSEAISPMPDDWYGTGLILLKARTKCNEST